MTEKTVIITGASKGLGAATAFVAAELGANIVLNARSTDLLAEHVAHIRNAGGNAIAVPGDVSRLEDCHRLVEEALTHFGRVDSVINSAGTIEPIAPIRRADPGIWQKNLEINLLGPMMLIQAALPQLMLHHGRIINVSSGAAVNAVPGWSGYCAAKAGLNHFNQVLAAEEKEVTAITFLPGIIDTHMQEVVRDKGAGGMPPEQHARFLRFHQQGELLPPEVPGGALAILSLYAPAEWSGQLMPWDDPRIQHLRLQYSAGH